MNKFKMIAYIALTIVLVLMVWYLLNLPINRFGSGGLDSSSVVTPAEEDTP